MKIAILALALSAAAANAQTMPSMPSGGLSGMLGSKLGGALPDVGSASKGNAAGLLGYCVENNVLSGVGAQSVLGTLSGKTGLAETDGYAAGQAGMLDTGNGSAVSLAGIKGQLRTKMCDQVLKRAKSFL